MGACTAHLTALPLPHRARLVPKLQLGSTCLLRLQSHYAPQAKRGSNPQLQYARQAAMKPLNIGCGLFGLD